MFNGLAQVMMSLHVAEAQSTSRSPEYLHRLSLVRDNSRSRRGWWLLGRVGRWLVAAGRRLEVYGPPQPLSLEGGTTDSR